MGVNKSIFLQRAPKNIRAVLQMQSERSHDELGATAVQYLQAATQYSSVHQRAGGAGGQSMSNSQHDTASALDEATVCGVA